MSNLRILWLLVLCVDLFVNQYEAASFKITRVHCESYNDSLMVINICRLKAFNRQISKFYMNVTLLQEFDIIDVSLDFRRKSNNGYRSYFYNFTIDACAFLRKKNNLPALVVFNLFKDFSNINHSCPYYGDVVLDSFYPSEDNLLRILPIPNGEYALYITWTMNKIKLLVTNFFFDFYLRQNVKY